MSEVITTEKALIGLGSAHINAHYLSADLFSTLTVQNDPKSHIYVMSVSNRGELTDIDKESLVKLFKTYDILAVSNNIASDNIIGNEVGTMTLVNADHSDLKNIIFIPYDGNTPDLAMIDAILRIDRLIDVIRVNNVKSISVSHLGDASWNEVMPDNVNAYFQMQQLMLDEFMQIAWAEVLGQPLIINFVIPASLVTPVNCE